MSLFLIRHHCVHQFLGILFYALAGSVVMWAMGDVFPVILHGLTDVLPMCGAFGTAVAGLADLLPMFIGQFLPLSFEVLHWFCQAFACLLL